MSDAGAADDGERYWAYREQMARIPREFGYVAADPLTGKPVPFDGYRPGAEGEPGTLLHAVDPQWAAPLNPDRGPGIWSVLAVNFILDLAERQARAAGGNAIEWHAAGAGTVKAVGRLLEGNGLAGQITVVHTPGPAGAAIPDHYRADGSTCPSVGVFWGDRLEDAEQCASRYLRMMRALEAAGLPGPHSWHAAVTGREHPVPLVMDDQAVAQLLIAGGQYTNETCELVPELGYRLHAVTAGDAPVSLTVRCGISVGQPGLVNSVVLTLAPSEQVQADWSGRSEALLRSFAEAWEPDRQHVTGGPVAEGGAAGVTGGPATEGGAAGVTGGPVEGGRDGADRGGQQGRNGPVHVDRSWRDEQYRRQIAGTSSGRGHVISGIRYDGWDPGANLLLGAVAPSRALVLAAGYPHARLAVQHELLLRARREAWASPGCRVEWHVAEPAAVHPVARLLSQAGLSERFVVRYTPPGDRPPVTRDVPATELPWLVARWRNRQEDAAKCAERLNAMLAALERLQPRAPWAWQAAISPAVGSVPMVGHPAAARELLLMGQSVRDEPEEVIGELGFLLTVRGGHGDQGISFHLSCGVHAGDPELRGVLVLDLPPSVAADGEASERAEAMLRAVEDAWEPDTARIADIDVQAGR
jgi:hypothetical protein